MWHITVLLAVLMDVIILFMFNWHIFLFSGNKLYDYALDDDYDYYGNDDGGDKAADDYDTHEYTKVIFPYVKT